MIGWTTKPLGEVAVFERGLTYSKADEVAHSRNGVLRANNIDLATKTLDLSEIRYIADTVQVPQAKKVRRDSLLICTASGSRSHLGKVALIDDDYDMAFGGFMGLITPGSSVDARYLYYLLTCPAYQAKLDSLAGGTNINNLKFTDIADFAVPLTPLKEQRRIVAVLDDAFAAIATATANAEKNFANARELFEAAARTAFEANLTASSFETAAVEALAVARKGSMRTGPFGSQLLHSEFVDDGVAVLGIDNAVDNEFRWGKRRFITEEKFQSLSRFLVHPGDVIITIMGTCGRCAVIPDDVPRAINSKHLFCISLDRRRCLPSYLHAYFLHAPDARAYLEERAQGSIMAGLNMGIIREMPVRLPSLVAQENLVRAIEVAKHSTDTLTGIYQRKLEALAALKQSLLNRAFAGELTAAMPEAVAA